MSAQALHEFLQGNSVTGSDPYDSERVRELERIGVKVYKTHEERNVIGIDKLVVTPAVSKDNPEYLYALRMNVPIQYRIDHFRELVNSYKGYAVTGTDGKSTTTSMLASVLINLGQDPYVFLGALHKKLEYGNYRKGNEICVYELDESQPGFEKFKPEYLIITNVREDHIENFNDLEHYYNAFNQLIENSKFVVTFADEKKFKGNVTFGVYAGDYRLVERKQEGYKQIITISTPNGIKKYTLPVPGFHNAINSLAVVSLLSSVGFDIENVLGAFHDFTLPGRRFNVIFDDSERKITVVDDYAHTPDEVEVLLKTAREVYQDRKIVLIFQPHRYTRFKREARRFAEVLGLADEIYITEVYGAFESKNGVSSKDIINEINPNLEITYVQNLEELKGIVFYDNTTYLFVGAGDIYNVSSDIVKSYKTTYVKS